MANLLSRLRRGPSERRYSIDQWAHDKAEWFSFMGHRFPAGFGFTYNGEAQEEPENSFTGYVQGAYKSDGIVFACSTARMLVFAEARFQWQRLTSGRPTDLWGDRGLAPLERPWPNGTTGELLSRAIQDADFAGNFFVVRERSRLRRLRPDWCSLVLTAPPEEAVAADVVGLAYKPGGLMSKVDPTIYLPNEFAHWSPIPDPDAHYRGMSWVTPILRELMADKAASTHKLRFFENAATPNLAVSLKETISPEAFKKFVAEMDDSHQGVDNAYKTLYLGGGADVTVIGADMHQLEFKATQGAGETRIAAAAGVHPVIVGLSEGLAGSSLNAGNFGAARRRFADGTIRPLWRSIAASLEAIVPPPAGSRLWYDDRDIPFLREDEKDAATIEQTKAATVRQYIDAGFEPASAVAAVDAQDISLLKHTGMTSVQLLPPGQTAPAVADPTS